jgi:hypothetical protein
VPELASRKVSHSILINNLSTCFRPSPTLLTETTSATKQLCQEDLRVHFNVRQEGTPWQKYASSETVGYTNRYIA